jgi:hypothetical protein
MSKRYWECLTGKLFNQCGKNRNLLDGLGDRLHQFVVPFDDWVDLLLYLLKTGVSKVYSRQSMEQEGVDSR